MSESPARPARSARNAGTRARRRRQWWQGGASVRRWNVELIAGALVGLGAGMLAGAALDRFVGGLAGTVAVWVGLIVPVVLAFRRSIPRGLLVLRPSDIIYAVVLGGILRIIQGWLAAAFGGSTALPAYPSLAGSLPTWWWVQDVLAGGIVAPVVEEFFFHGLLLVAIFTVVRRFVRRSAPAGAGSDAGIGLGLFVAVLATTGLFVLTHQLVAPLTADAAVTIALLGAGGGLLVGFTGRIWPAVLVHVVFNLTGVALTVAGTLLG